MLLGKRSVYCLLVSIAAIGVVFRYPISIGHELGADTTFIHSLTNNILQTGSARWIVNPFSYFGLYALSYPSAIPFLFASTSTVGGIPVEASMLVIDWVITIPATLGCFLAARRIRRDDVFSLLVATFFTLSPFYIKDTFWNGSSRGYVVALMPVVLLLIMRHLKRQTLQDFVLIFLLFGVLATIHRMGLLVFFLFVAYIFTIPFHKVTLRLRAVLFPYEKVSRYGFFAMSVVAFVGMLYLEFLYPTIAGADLASEYGDGALLRGQSFPVILANIVISITGRVGLLTPLAIIGLILSLWHRPKEITDKYILVSFLIFLPMLSFRDYVAEFMILFFVALSVIGLLAVSRRFLSRRRIAVATVALLVAVSVVGSWTLKDYWQSRFVTDGQLPGQAYQTGLYLRNLPAGNAVSNEGLLAGQLAAVSGRPILPLGGASLHWTGPQQLTWGFVDPSSIATRLLSFPEMSFNTNEIFVSVNTRNAEVDWETIMIYNQPAAAVYDVRYYNIHYAAIDATNPTSFLAYNRNFSSGLLALANQLDYEVYDSGPQVIWLVS